MSALLTVLGYVLHRPWLLASLATLASACVLLLVSVALSMHQVRQNESAQMNARGERFLERLEQVFGQLREGVDQLQTLPSGKCDEAMLSALRQVGFSYRFVYEAAYVNGTI